MTHDRERRVRTRVSLLLVGPLIAPLVLLSSPFVLPFAAAQSAPADSTAVGDWEPLEPGFNPRVDPVDAIFTPARGPLFVTRSPNSRIYRNDDAGSTWAEVPRPDRASLMAIDPTDHQIMYFRGPGGLYKSFDGGATIEPSLTTGEDIRIVVVSPADHDLVYLGTSNIAVRPSRATLYRSRDGGLSWEEIDVFSGESGCTPYPEILYPHPTDADRLFYFAACGSGKVRTALRHSRDRGASWTDVWEPPCGTPRQMTGGRGGAPDRFYLFDRATALDCPSLPTGSAVFRSDDDGTAWAETARFDGPFIAGIADDPEIPDRVYAALYGNIGQGAGVKVSEDGGSIWTDLGSTRIGEVSSLALGIDGAYLFASGRRGFWRIRLR